MRPIRQKTKAKRKDLLKAGRFLMDQVNYLKSLLVHVFDQGYDLGYSHATGGKAHQGDGRTLVVTKDMKDSYQTSLEALLKAQADPPKEEEHPTEPLLSTLPEEAEQPPE